MVGIVKKWFEDKGYGFISRESDGDIFVHFSSIISNNRKSLRVGDKVEFEIENYKGKTQAKKVKVI